MQIRKVSMSDTVSFGILTRLIVKLVDSMTGHRHRSGDAGDPHRSRRCRRPCRCRCRCRCRRCRCRCRRCRRFLHASGKGMQPERKESDENFLRSADVRRRIFIGRTSSSTRPKCESCLLFHSCRQGNRPVEIDRRRQDSSGFLHLNYVWRA